MPLDKGRVDDPAEKQERCGEDRDRDESEDAWPDCPERYSQRRRAKADRRFDPKSCFANGSKNQFIRQNDRSNRTSTRPTTVQPPSEIRLLLASVTSVRRT
jgi:hypothetical protein